MTRATADDRQYLRGNGEAPQALWSCIELSQPEMIVHDTAEQPAWIIRVVDAGVDDAVCFVLSVHQNGEYVLVRTQDRSTINAVAFTSRADAEKEVERLWHIFPHISGNLVWDIVER